VLAGETIRVEGQAVCDGSVFDVGATLSPVRTGDLIVGVAFIVQDIALTCASAAGDSPQDRPLLAQLD
jgi:hypothetical protein